MHRQMEKLTAPKHTGVIIQARTGSTRLPGKMTREFHGGHNLFDMCLLHIGSRFSRESLLVATTVNPADDVIAELSAKHGVGVYRGSEENVVQRFVEAADYKGWTKIIRICADNPFLMVDEIWPLIETVNADSFDYVSFFFSDNTPSIRTHSGFFGEAVRTDALKSVLLRTDDRFFMEHVTNYIYGHEDIYRVKKLKIEREELIRKIRLTIDTEEDFVLAQQLYEISAKSGRVDYEKLFDHLINHPEVLEIMSHIISQHAK
jgi:spore coat polysaccharide biosynthesis protein SpsF (cytidylyltransferase family)